MARKSFTEGYVRLWIQIKTLPSEEKVEASSRHRELHFKWLGRIRGLSVGSEGFASKKERVGNDVRNIIWGQNEGFLSITVKSLDFVL